MGFGFGFGQRPAAVTYITITPEWALVSVGEWPLHNNTAAINL
jgi:hypothetical protein